MTIHAYGAYAGDQPLQAMTIFRRTPGPHDVQVDIAYCGICHSDIHQVRSEWPGIQYPCVPGHEIVGHVSAVGRAVTRFNVGDQVGIGCFVDSCRQCPDCNDGLENYCEDMVFTYNGKTSDPPGHTLGGYSQRIVTDERFVLHIRHPEDQLAAVAPLLCAGITMYSPLRHWRIGPASKVGIVGIGGLGHLGIKLARAMGAHVVALTTSPDKRHTALELGAHEVVLSRSPTEMAACAQSLDIILNTVATPHDLNPYFALLKRDGTQVLIGIPADAHAPPDIFDLVMKRRSLAGSLVGGLPETQEMLDFCAQHRIVADIEMIQADQINEAYERMLNSDVKYRFVIDNASLAA